MVIGNGKVMSITMDRRLRYVRKKDDRKWLRAERYWEDLPWI